MKFYILIRKSLHFHSEHEQTDYLRTKFNENQEHHNYALFAYFTIKIRPIYYSNGTNKKRNFPPLFSFGIFHRYAFHLPSYGFQWHRRQSRQWTETTESSARPTIRSSALMSFSDIWKLALEHSWLSLSACYFIRH